VSSLQDQMRSQTFYLPRLIWLCILTPIQTYVSTG
jgi:hypothetical protein